MIRRLIFFWKRNRLAPDMLSTHFLLYFKKTARWLCKKKFAHFGEEAEFRPFAYADNTKGISIGARVIIRAGSMLFAGDSDQISITIEDDVLMANGVHIYVDNHIYDNINISILSSGYGQMKPVILKKGCWLGANVIVLSGVTIGEHSVVGAGSVVTKSVPPYTVWAGNPAEQIKTITRP